LSKGHGRLKWKGEDDHPCSDVTSLEEFVGLKSDTKEDSWSQIEVSHECFVVVLIAEVTYYTEK